MSPDPFFIEAFVEFADALSSLESIAALYPVTHKHSREAGARALGAIALLSDASGMLSLERAEERWMLGSEVIPLSTPAVQALRSTFDCLGLSRLEIDAESTGEHLYQLVRSMRALSQRIQTTPNLQAADLIGLPSTIRVRFRSSNQPAATGTIAQSSALPADTMVELACTPLSSPSVDEETREVGRKWVENSMRRIVERVESETTSSLHAEPDVPRRSLDDVLQLAGRTMAHTLTEFLTQTSDHDELKRMFKSIEMATEVCDDPEAARLVVDVLNASAREVLSKSEAPPKRTDEPSRGEECRLSFDELCQQLALLKPAIDQMANLERDGRSEAFSIALGSLIRSASDAALTRIVAKLPTLLTPPWTPIEEETLAEAIRALCASATERTIDRALPVISACLGIEKMELWLGIAAESARADAPERLTILWPHLANEVLLGPRSNSEGVLSRALTQLGRLPQAGLQAGITRLEELSALRHGPLSPFAFTCEREDLVPLYAALLQSQRQGEVGELLLASLKTRPPAWKCGVVFQTFAHCDTSCRELIYDLLQHGSLNQAQPSTQLKAGRLIAECILTLPPERAGEAWVPNALEALSGQRSSDAEHALRRILSERKGMVLPLWPAACRAAARRSLSELERAAGAPKD